MNMKRYLSSNRTRFLPKRLMSRTGKVHLSKIYISFDSDYDDGMMILVKPVTFCGLAFEEVDIKDSYKGAKSLSRMEVVNIHPDDMSKHVTCKNCLKVYYKFLKQCAKAGSEATRFRIAKHGELVTEINRAKDTGVLDRDFFPST